MNDILTYDIKMKLSGRITQLPDSQKIFGALIYAYAEATSAKAATQLVAKIKDGSFYFSLSNMLPMGYLPVPQSELIDRMDDHKEDSKKVYTALKKRQYLPIEKIMDWLDNPNKPDCPTPYIYSKLSQQTHNAIDSVRYDIPGMDPNLYSVPETTIIKADDHDESGVVAEEEYNQFNFYLAVEDCIEGKVLIDTLRKEQERQSLFIRGAKSSYGFNIFVIENIASAGINYQKDDTLYLNLGMLLPKEIDFEKSTLKLFTSERRPYDKVGGWEDMDCTKQFISFIEAGSIICSTNGFNQVGQSIASPFDDRAIVFGNAFLYPFPVNQGGVQLGKVKKI